MRTAWDIAAGILVLAIIATLVVPSSSGPAIVINATNDFANLIRAAEGATSKTATKGFSFPQTLAAGTPRAAAAQTQIVT